MANILFYTWFHCRRQLYVINRRYNSRLIFKTYKNIEIMAYLENIMLSNLDSRKKQVAETITAIQTATIQNTDYLSDTEKINLDTAVITLNRLNNELTAKYDYILNL